MKDKTIPVILILIGILFFAFYCWWAASYNHISGGWGGGIWIAAALIFIMGIVGLYNKDDD